MFIFFIYTAKNGNLDRVVHTFVSESIEKAIMYFESLIENDDNFKKKRLFLYKIAKFDKDLNIKKEKCFIRCSEETKFKKISLFEEKEKIRKAIKAKTKTECLEILFEGKLIK